MFGACCCRSESNLVCNSLCCVLVVVNISVQLRMTSVTPLRLVSRLFKPVSPVRTITLAYVTKQCDKGSTETYNSSYEPDIGNLYTEEHLSLRKTVRKIIDKDINPHVDEWEAAGEFPIRELFKKLGNAGILGVNMPQEFGGLGLDWSYSLAVAEELGYINCGSIPMAIGVQTEMSTQALAKFGSDELRKQFLAPAVAGDMIASIGVSELSAGSDVAAIKTQAVRKGDDYVINGSKMWITNGLKADWMCMLANTGSGPVHKNKSLIIVPLNTKGIERVKIDKLGMDCSDTAQIFFEDVRVPISYCIGEENHGFLYQMQQFQLERLFASGSLIIGLETIIKETAEYCSQRKAFGYPLINNQIIHYTLAELQTEVEALRALTYRAVARYIRGEDVTYLASMCKLKVGRLARQVTDSCLQYWGGMGYTKEVKVSRMYRDFRLVSIGGGADEVMLGIICKYMETLPTVK
ncbi:hypothetical protein LSH36_15g16009 [Paralvinella palmiformis]|uniref:Acyl-CoA dehydrogenase 6 n=1 Tax=Paralvinella palmiformis TaxID=53620 RepID=A0AAD9KC93_9ANNE|nr:hypothetical protein LSH36_15g16009 [Paralvinella palmiformis]